MSGSPRYRFAELELDASTGELSGPAGRRRLEPQPARVLALLLARAGELVTREEIRREVWPDTHVDFDQGLNYCIRQIRTALGESAEAPRFIETLPRRGYRFVVPVERAGPIGPPRPVEPVGAAEPPEPARPPKGAEPPASVAGTASTRPGAAAARGARSAARRKMFMALVALIGIAAAVSWRLLENRPAHTPATEPPAIRIAVLPFHGTDRPPTAWEERLTEALVVALTERGGDRLAVVGPATTAPLVRERLPQGELGRRVSAQFVISGGIRADGATVFAQLLGAPDAVGREIAQAALAALDARSQADR
jgi:DNA-binding winged helix-turn-helix (wHTH) protein/TolB-like protein